MSGEVVVKRLNGFNAEEGTASIAVKLPCAPGCVELLPMNSVSPRVHTRLLATLVATERGIYAAMEILRHSDISTTAWHYTHQKNRASVGLGDAQDLERILG